MKHYHHSKLTIQNDIASLHEAQACLSSVAGRIGFSGHDNKHLQLALEEALTNVIRHSFAPGELADIDIEFTQIPLGLRISIWVKGIPFDPALFPVYSRKELEENLNDRGLGNYLVRQVMDEYAYINHGRDGIEAIMVKNLPAQSIEEIIRGEKTEKPVPGEKAAAKQDFSVGLMKPEEAVEVSRLAYYAYGYTYPYEKIYYPDKVARLNESGKMVSMVARLESGEIIGHAALERASDEFDNAELGIAFSNPSYRGMGIMNRLWEALIEEAARERIFGVFAMSVTTHPFSQKASHHFGLNDCSLLLSKGPVISFRDIQESTHPRESIMITYRYLFPPGKLVIYPPPEHSVMVRKILNNLGIEPEIRESPAAIDDLRGKRTELKVKPAPALGTATIQVDRYGEHVVKKVAEDLRQFCVERHETIYLALNLHDPYTAVMCREFESKGFFFAGLHPAGPETTFLVLQYLNNQVMDYDALRLDSDFGKQLAAYVRSCDPGAR
jgi:serine/threonine-protein kinase RsbW